jgi:16S rRNA (guanine966-N2)-methyltransferase
MRVIAGDHRGRRVVTPRGLETRPVTARVRESIFSRLAARDSIVDATVLDLFAGSGAFGLEALSRGARRVVFVDRSLSAARAIRQNLRRLKLSQRAVIINTDYRSALRELSAGGERFRLAFIDPPFDADSTTETLALIATLGLLAPGGLVVTRQFHRTPEPVITALERVSMVKIGDHRVTFFQGPEL